MENIYYFIDESGSNKEKIFCRPIIMVIDWLTNHSRQRNYFWLILSVIDDCGRATSQINEGIRKVQDSNFISKYDNFKIFHASSDNFNVRTIFVNLLKKITYRSYIIAIIKEKNFHSKQTEITFEMFCKIVKDLLLKNKEKNNIFCFETCGLVKDEIAKKRYIKIIDEINYELIKKHKIKEKILFDIEIKNKEEEPLLSISDYMGFVVSQNYKRKPDQPTIGDYYKFLASKIGLLHDVSENKFYNSKNPYKIINY
jgi:hypothetical protein